MINTLKPSSTLGHDSERGQILEKISKEYGPPQEKQREATKKLGKDEFFKIMVTQIQHQDPLKPYQNEQMAAQMAQFSSLEQMVNMNQNLEKLTQSQAPMHQLGAAGLIGKYVTSDSSRVIHADGTNTELNFELPADVREANITIFNERGENVREINAKDLKQGAAKVVWDGRKSNSLAAPSGNYRFSVSANSELGKPIEVQTKNTSLVHGVSFDGKDTILLTGDMRNPQKVQLKTVARIVDPHAEQAAANPQAGPLPQAGEMDDLSKTINDTAESESPKGENLDVKYSPVDVKDFRKGGEKADSRPAISSQQMDQMREAANDLSGANPIGQALRNGEPLPVEEAAPSDMSMINPAAMERGMQALTNEQRQQIQGQLQNHENVAEKNNMPSSQDGSISGE